MNKLVTIPGNEHAIQVFENIIRSREGLGFVGAGVSAGLYPLWKQTIHTLADEAVRTGRSTDADKRFWLTDLCNDPLAAAQRIKEALGASIYRSILYSMFSPRQDREGKHYTDVHSAVVRLGLRGIVTTNYDPGILEARLRQLPKAAGTGWCTWRDPDDLERWLHGTIFKEHTVPILFAHGIYERTETILLTNAEYREAYVPGLYRMVFDRLWTDQRLVIIGYGFSDPWLRFICNEALNQARASSGPRHVALIGLLPEQPYTPEMRAHFGDAYNTDVIFYPIEHLRNEIEDHSALKDFLEQFVPAAEPARGPVIHPDAQRHTCRQNWVHETTNDDRYVGRRDAVEDLIRWSGDPSVRVISVTAMGGQGKTALIGNWLRVHHAQFSRSHEGLLFWSFYANRAVKDFLNEYLEFVGRNERIVPPQSVPKKQTRLVTTAIEALQKNPYVLILDGLEVLQERPGMPGYGRFLEDDLCEFLEAAARLKHPSLIILTSRFPFADLQCYLGSTVRNLVLDRLRPDEGADLLLQCGVQGTGDDRVHISQFFEGHPLALRIFAATLHTQRHGDPTRLWKIVFDKAHLRADDPWESKLSRLLQFYDSHLPVGQRTALGVISLFGTPIEQPVVEILVPKAMGTSRPALGPDAGTDLAALVESGLLLRERTRGVAFYSCHPMVRDHFRQALVVEAGGIAVDAAQMLLDRPSSDTPTTVAQIMPTLNAIELLIEAEHMRRANDLYERRLLDGEAFLIIPAVHEGQRCAASFVATTERRNQCRQQLRAQSVFRFLNKAGLFAAAAGEPADALAFYDQAVAATRTTNNKLNMAIALRNRCAILTHLGRLNDARNAGTEALSLLRRYRQRPVEIASCLAELGFTTALSGQVEEATSLFKDAEQWRPQEPSYETGIWQLREAEILLRLGQIERARSIVRTCLGVSANLKWRHDYAICQMVLGKIESARNRFVEAEECFRECEAILRSGHLLTDLPRLLLARADLRLRQKRLDEALHILKECLPLAAMRELRVCHADALTFRGRAMLQSHAASKTKNDSNDLLLRALDDGRDALRISQQSGYLWAEQEALALLADIWTQLRKAEEASLCRKEAISLMQRLIPASDRK